MRNRKFCTGAKLLIVLILSLLLGLSAAQAATVNVYTDQIVYEVLVGDTFTIKTLVDTQSIGVGQWANIIAIDETELMFESVTTDTDTWPFSGSEPVGDEAYIGGKYFDFGLPGGDAPSGSDVNLYTIELLALKVGPAKYAQSVLEQEWEDEDGNALDVEFREVIINVVPVPAAVWLLGGGLVGLLGLRKRFLN